MIKVASAFFLIAACCMTYSAPALAEPVLWRTLEAGESPEDVKIKLEQMIESNGSKTFSVAERSASKT